MQKNKRDFSEMYEKLTPKNQRVFGEKVATAFGWSSRRNVYYLIKGRRSVNAIEESFICDLFNRLYDEQIKSVQL